MHLITIQDLLDLRKPALEMHHHPDPRWPPSVYYRYLGLVLKKLNGKRAVELGTCGGGAALNMALMNPQAIVHSVDIEKLPQVDGVIDMCPNFRFHLLDSVVAAGLIGPQTAPIDLLFIDTTAHDPELEYKVWLPYMRKGGVVCFDDVYYPPSTRFFESLPNRTQLRDLHEMHIGEAPYGGFGAHLVL
jgi:predicted O-methyltransferase YrrM